MFFLPPNTSAADLSLGGVLDPGQRLHNMAQCIIGSDSAAWPSGFESFREQFTKKLEKLYVATEARPLVSSDSMTPQSPATIGAPAAVNFGGDLVGNLTTSDSRELFEVFPLFRSGARELFIRPPSTLPLSIPGSFW